MSAVVAEMIDTPVYNEYVGGSSVSENVVSVNQAYSYSFDDWRALSDSEFIPAIVAMAKDARNRPSSDWADVRERMYAKHGGGK